MIQHPSISVLFVVEDNDATLTPFLSYLQSMPHIRPVKTPQLPDNLNSYDVVVTYNSKNSVDTIESLTRFVLSGGGWFTLVHLSENPLPELFGVQQEPVGPPAELRILFENNSHPLAERLPDTVYVNGHYQGLRKTADDTETVLYADWHYSHTPVLTQRVAGKGRLVCTTLQAYSDSNLQQIFYRLLCSAAAQPMGGRILGVGILGYAPSVGQVHGLATEATSGLKLRAVCDLNPERLNQARQDFHTIKTHQSPKSLADDPEVEAVIIATPPNVHAQLCLQMMRAGKHVVCEKPLALNRRETDALVEMAEKRKVHLSCHQNRRWDPDYLAIRQALGDGLIGDLFYLESFVGDFHHPCGYWHSHAPVSGGTAYDWGAHYLDWLVSLMPDKVESVVGTRHKRVWHDVTNADQERIQIRFTSGKEAEFMHSNIAAVRKPKWYLLGTEGAIIGLWRDVTTYEVDPVLYFHQHDIPATEMTPDITVYRRYHTGKIIQQKPAMPEREIYPFHRNLADHLLTGEPIAAPLADSVKVVSILEAAALSMANGGAPEVLNVG
jgi:predicted dehydrogenase